MSHKTVALDGTTISSFFSFYWIVGTHHDANVLAKVRSEDKWRFSAINKFVCAAPTKRTKNGNVAGSLFYQLIMITFTCESWTWSCVCVSMCAYYTWQEFLMAHTKSIVIAYKFLTTNKMIKNLEVFACGLFLFNRPSTYDFYFRLARNACSMLHAPVKVPITGNI